MSAFLGRVARTVRSASGAGPGPFDSFVDSLVQKLENCRAGLGDDALAGGPPAVESWAATLYGEEVPRLKDAIRVEEPHLSPEARDELFRNVDELVRRVVLPGWARPAARFTPRERNGFYALSEGLHGVERAAWAVLGMALGFLVVWAPFVPIWSKEWVLPFTIGGLVFPELRRWLSFRSYEKEMNALVSRTDREIARLDLAYLTETTAVADREASDDARARSRARDAAAKAAIEREG